MRTILDEIEDFLLLYPEVKPRELGRGSIGDKSLVANMRAGRELRRATEERVRAWMVAYARQAEAARLDRIRAVKAARQRLARTLFGPKPRIPAGAAKSVSARA